MLEFTQSSKKPTNKIYSWESTYILIQNERVTFICNSLIILWRISESNR